MALDTVIQFAKRLVESAVKSGDLVIDATVGQGHDTLFLAELVGLNGAVFGFDIQEEALATARNRVNTSLSLKRSISWVLGSHEFMLKDIPPNWMGQVSAIMFNLGYLPGFDHHVTTTPTATLAALEASACLLRSQGIITVVVYTGHTGAQKEANAVMEWASRLPQKEFNVLSYNFVNQKNNPPFLMAIEKK